MARLCRTIVLVGIGGVLFAQSSSLNPRRTVVHRRGFSANDAALRFQQLTNSPQQRIAFSASNIDELFGQSNGPLELSELQRTSYRGVIPEIVVEQPRTPILSALQSQGSGEPVMQSDSIFAVGEEDASSPTAISLQTHSSRRSLLGYLKHRATSTRSFLARNRRAIRRITYYTFIVGCGAALAYGTAQLYSVGVTVSERCDQASANCVETSENCLEASRLLLDVARFGAGMQRDVGQGVALMRNLTESLGDTPVTAITETLRQISQFFTGAEQKYESLMDALRVCRERIPVDGFQGIPS